MENSVRAVATKEELKKAMDDGVDRIVIIDKKLAGHVKAIKSAGMVKISLALAAATAAGAVGLASGGSGFVAAAGFAGISAGTSSVLITAIITLGFLANRIILLRNGYVDTMSLDANYQISKKRKVGVKLKTDFKQG